MQITGVDVHLASFGGYCNYVLVKVSTEDGIVGWGDASLVGRERAVAATVAEDFAPLVVGRDAMDTEDVWQTLYRGGYWRGGPVLMSALAGIDLALWDLKGRAAGMPVYQLLGGRCRRGALAYGHATGASIDEICASVEVLLAAGYRVVRCQGASYSWSATPGEAARHAWPPPVGGAEVESFDVDDYLRTVPRMLDAVRNRFGEAVGLCHDAHQRLTVQQAARLARSVEAHRLVFLEDVVRPELAHQLGAVRRVSVTPLALGELLHSLPDCLPLLRDRLIDFVRCDVAHAGGISEARRIATVADAFGIRTAWHGPIDISPIARAASVHLDVALPGFGIQEHCPFPDAVTDVIRTGVRFEGGLLDVGEEPGLGVDVDETALRGHPFDYRPLPMARHTDGTLRDW